MSSDNRTEVRKENKMGVMPVNKLIITMSLPMMISMLVQAMYNIVDSIFVAQINEYALTAVSLVFPFQGLMIAFSTGTAVGYNAFLSKSLGEKEFDRANEIAKNAIFLALCTYFGFLLLGQFAAGPFLRIQTDIPEIIDYGVTYMRIVSIFSFGMFLQMCLERLLQSTGRTFYTMITQTFGALINLVFDPILIFGLFGFPKLGIAGAAMATIFGQILAGIMAYYFNKTKNEELDFNLKHFAHFRPNFHIIRRIYSIGIPSIIMASIGSVMTFGMNRILMAFTSTATAVFGAYFKLQSFVFMPVFGLNNGLVPIISYNYGARKPERITQTIKSAIIFAVSIMAFGTVLFEAIPITLLKVFNASDNMLEIGVPALRIIAMHFIIAGISIPLVSTLQALGHGVKSLIISVVRQLVVLLPSAFILSRSFGLNATWFAFPIAEIASLILCSFFMKSVYEEEIKPLKQTTAA